MIQSWDAHSKIICWQNVGGSRRHAPDQADPRRHPTEPAKLGAPTVEHSS